jgi:hypothetical protein
VLLAEGKALIHAPVITFVARSLGAAKKLGVSGGLQSLASSAS